MSLTLAFITRLLSVFGVMKGLIISYAYMVIMRLCNAIGKELFYVSFEYCAVR
jgi:hypothetical protein